MLLPVLLPPPTRLVLPLDEALSVLLALPLKTAPHLLLVIPWLLAPMARWAPLLT